MRDARIWVAASAGVTAGLVMLALTAGAGGAGGGGPYGDGSGPAVENPCHGKLARLLRCPNLRMGPPRDLYVTRSGPRILLHATNDIKSRGEGPLEVRGKRYAKRRMRVRQVIHTTRGGRRYYKTNARLIFYDIPGQGRYWKFHKAVRFEIWTIRRGRRARLVRVGPKLNYCFRDLVRTKPSRRSPRHPVYPACSQDPSKRFRTLGTSVGWSDIYPATYYENWINVRGLRGCFAFVLRADPANLLYENRERDNVGARRIRLPPKGDRVRSCWGRRR